MQKSISKLGILLVVFVLLTNSSFSQRYNRQLNPQCNLRQSDRLCSLKTTKIIDALELNEQESTKFEEKFNTIDKDVREKHDKLRLASDELELAVKYKKSDKEISDKSNQFINAHKDFQDAMNYKLTAVKDILNPTQFAKFLLFEKRFNQRVNKYMNDRPKQGKRSGGRGFKGNR